MKKLSVIIPVFNEQNSILKILDKVLLQKEVTEIIVVNDGSTDKTVQILKKVKNKKVKIFNHFKNQGKGAAIRTGLEKAKSDFVIIQDADLEYDPSEYKNLLTKADKNIAVFGSRILGKNPHAYTRTYLGNILLSTFASFLFNRKLTDTYTCYKLIPAAVAKKLKLKSNGFEMEAEITAKLAKNNVPIIEVPISYYPRSYEQGKKIKAKDALTGAWTFLKIRLNLGNLQFLYFIVLLTFISRLIYQANYLDDWDSVQFALGIHDFSISIHQPHPPGYPFYILLGKLSHLLFQDDLKALAFLSTLFGSLILIPLYLLSKKMFNQPTALITILLFAFTPLTWLLSELALTDIPGLFFLILAIYLIYTTKDNYKNFLLTCLFSGLILGIRSNSVLILIGLILFVTAKKHNPKFAIFSIALFLIGIAIWLIPIIFITGPKPFLQSYSSISNYVIAHDVFLGSTLSLKTIIKLKVEQFWYLLKIGYTPWFSILSIIIFSYLLLKKKLWAEFKYQFLSVWLIAHLIPQLIVYNLEMPRHTLPLLPPVLILVSSVFSQLIRKKIIFISLLFLLFAALFSQGWSQVSRFKQQTPPTILPIQYVKKNFDPQKTIIISSLTYRHFQYYAPEYKIYYGDKISQLKISPEQTVILDYPGLRDKISQPSSFKIAESYEFRGDRDIFPRVSKTNLYILK